MGFLRPSQPRPTISFPFKSLPSAATANDFLKGRKQNNNKTSSRRDSHRLEATCEDFVCIIRIGNSTWNRVEAYAAEALKAIMLRAGTPLSVTNVHTVRQGGEVISIQYYQ